VGYIPIAEEGDRSRFGCGPGCGCRSSRLGGGRLGERFVRDDDGPLGAATLTTTDPRSSRSCSVTERRITRVVEPGPGDVIDVERRYLTDPSSQRQLQRAAYDAYRRMKAAAEADGIPSNLLTVVSGYRSVRHQEELWRKALQRYGSPQEARQWVAPPGGSPHHTGRAIDLYLGTRNDSSNVLALRATVAYRWLVCNAERFGFTPYAREPWHWEYNPPGFAPGAPTPATAAPQAPGAQPPMGPMPSAAADARVVDDALRRGVRDEARLTDLVFHGRHPERGGRPITQGETRAGQEWRWIRDNVVKPRLLRAGTARPVTPMTASTTAPAGTPPGLELRRMALLVPLLERYRRDIPLEFLLGWIAVESGGRIDVITPRLNERGFFQIHPDESKDRGFQHERLTTDPDYSVQAGIANVRYYADLARQRFPSIPPGSELFWRIVKLQHAMGSPLARRLLDSMRASNIPLTWEAIKRYEVTNGPGLHRLLTVQPLGRFGRNVDSAIAKGRKIATALGKR